MAERGTQGYICKGSAVDSLDPTVDDARLWGEAILRLTFACFVRISKTDSGNEVLVGSQWRRERGFREGSGRPSGKTELSTNEHILQRFWRAFATKLVFFVHLVLLCVLVDIVIQCHVCHVVHQSKM